MKPLCFLCVLESMESSVKSENKANVTVRWSIKKREKEADLDVRNVVYQSSVMYPRRCLCTPPATAASHNAAWESRRDKWETGGRAILSSFFFFGEVLVGVHEGADCGGVCVKNDDAEMLRADMAYSWIASFTPSERCCMLMFPEPGDNHSLRQIICSCCLLLKSHNLEDVWGGGGGEGNWPP